MPYRLSELSTLLIAVSDERSSRLDKGVTSIGEAGDIHFTHLGHCFGVCLSNLGWLGQKAVARFETSPTACELECEPRDSVISEAIVTVLSCLGDDFT